MHFTLKQQMLSFGVGFTSQQHTKHFSSTNTQSFLTSDMTWPLLSRRSSTQEGCFIEDLRAGAGGGARRSVVEQGEGCDGKVSPRSNSSGAGAGRFSISSSVSPPKEKVSGPLA